jgi:hypothetical protein
MNRKHPKKPATPPAFVEGFESLMFKVEAIRSSQEASQQQIGDIHQAVYDPDEGLFARIRMSDQSNKEKITALEVWREQVDVDRNAHDEGDVEINIKVKALEETVKDLSGWRDRALGVWRWVFAAFGAATVTLVFKFIYDIVKTHIKFVF